MFRKVLIANRGEVAIRVIRSCQERGIGTVGIFSDADRAALHVRYVDEAYRVGGPASSDSYLRIDRIVDVARRAGVDAVHPGYGFLAENAEFAAAVQDAGLTFIGPGPDAIATMGDKVQARRAIQGSDVPVLPGTGGGLADAALKAAAAEIGFPLMIKAAAGGGGKGMRIVQAPAEFDSALATARRESQSSFGNDDVYLEKYVARSRHIEIQILADSFGRTIHLGERECSIQRRHQKLIEEAPSVAVDAELRRQMGRAAVQAAEAVQYVNAGTVEFLFDAATDRFYFLEMNTRLQVEHPVTELVTGIDIVKEQFSIADGRRLRYAQADVRPSGWAIECRITAEDPFRNFMPSSGVVSFVQEPTGPGVRVESSLYRGCPIDLYYDPMVAKLIVWGETRAEAIMRMRRALNEYRIAGVKTSIPFHISVMKSTEFMMGRFDTGFIDRKQLVDDADERRLHARVAAIAAALITHEERRQAITLGAGASQGPSDLWRLAGRMRAAGGRW